MQLGSDMGNPREAGYFNDGITEDIITKLFRFSERFVIARNLSFRYRDSHVDLHAVIGRKVLGGIGEPISACGAAASDCRPERP
jgi:hypothetical protein